MKNLLKILPFDPIKFTFYAIITGFAGIANPLAAYAAQDSANVSRIEADVTTGSAPLTVNFSVIHPENAVDFLWIVNGDSINGGATLKYRFDRNGTYDIDVIVYLENQESDTLSDPGLIHLFKPHNTEPDLAPGTPVALLKGDLLPDSYIQSGSDSESVVQNCFFPNSFTPNNDGLNDIFNPVFYSTESFSSWSFCIYNRWGEKVFESTQPAMGWDGNFQGDKSTAGNYIYTFKAIDVSGKIFKTNGRVYLIR